MREKTDIPSLIKYVRQLSSDIKKFQPVGADMLSLKVSQKSITYSIPSYTTSSFIVTFTAAKQRNPYAELNYSNNEYIDIVPVYSPSPIQKRFRIDILNATGSTRSLTMNWYVVSTDVGVIS